MRGVTPALFSRWKRQGPATNLQERMRSLPKWELIGLYARRSQFFFLRLDLLLLLHCRLRLLHGKLLEHLAIIKFALCHFVSRGSMVRHVTQFLGHDGQSGP